MNSIIIGEDTNFIYCSINQHFEELELSTKKKYYIKRNESYHSMCNYINSNLIDEIIVILGPSGPSRSNQYEKLNTIDIANRSIFVLQTDINNKINNNLEILFNILTVDIIDILFKYKFLNIYNICLIEKYIYYLSQQDQSIFIIHNYKWSIAKYLLDKLDRTTLLNTYKIIKPNCCIYFNIYVLTIKIFNNNKHINLSDVCKSFINKLNEFGFLTKINYPKDFLDMAKYYASI